MVDDPSVSEPLEEEWDAFVYAHPQGNIFQTMALFRVYEEAKWHAPIRVFSRDPATGRLQGVLTGVVIREMDGFLGDFSSRSIIQGGPLIAPGSRTDEISALVRRYDDIASKVSLYSEIRNMTDTQELLHPEGYSLRGHLNFLTRLDRSETDVWKQLHLSRKKHIRRAERAGMVFEELVDLGQILVVYGLLQETYGRVKVPLADISLFESVYRNLVPQGLAKFFFARLDDEYLAARVALLYKGSIYDWYACASNEGLTYYPNDFLVWNILKWGVANRFLTYDFAGAGDPEKHYGPREFKRRFGGDEVNFGRYIRTYSGIKTGISRTGFELYRRLFL